MVPDGEASETAAAGPDAVLRELIRLAQDQLAALCAGDLERVRELMATRAGLLHAWQAGHPVEFADVSPVTDELQRALASADADLARALEERLGTKAEELRQVRCARRAWRSYLAPRRAGSGRILDRTG